MNRNRESRTRRQLRADSAHVLYEVEMLHAMHERFEPGTSNPLAIHNACLEALLIHARALIGFMWPRHPRKTDVLAVDFVPDWPGACPPQSDFLREVKTRADLEIAHVTQTRGERSGGRPYEPDGSLTVPGWGWMTGTIWVEVGKPFQIFAHRVPPDLVLDGWHERAFAVLPDLPKRSFERVSLLGKRLDL